MRSLFPRSLLLRSVFLRLLILLAMCVGFSNSGHVILAQEDPIVAKFQEYEAQVQLHGAGEGDRESLLKLRALARECMAIGGLGPKANCETLLNVGRLAECNADYELARTIYEELRTVLAAETDFAGHDKIREELSERFQQLDRIGSPLKISGKTYEGTEFDPASLQGKVVLIEFWASWCRPCKEQFPVIKEQYERHHQEGFEVVTINLDRNREDLATFLHENDFPYTILALEPREGDAEKSEWAHPLAEQYKICRIPSSFLIDRDGKVVAINLKGKHLGAILSEFFPQSLHK